MFYYCDEGIVDRKWLKPVENPFEGGPFDKVVYRNVEILSIRQSLLIMSWSCNTYSTLEKNHQSFLIVRLAYPVAWA